MNDKIKAFWLGTFLIVGILLTAWLILFLRPSFGDGKVTLKIRFSNIDKIEKGTRVTFAGKPVGEVVKIVEVPNPRQSAYDEFGTLYLYELTLKVDSIVHVYSYDDILFATAGLLGEKSIAIIPKATPKGAPPAQEITNTVLFGASTDRVEKTLRQVSQIAQTLQNTLDKANHFFDENLGGCHGLCTSITAAADALHLVMQGAVESHFVERVANAADCVGATMSDIGRLAQDILDKQLVAHIGESLQDINTMTKELVRGEGTLGKLIHSDTLYLQASGVMSKADHFFRDLNQYGLLFQYDKGWQRARAARMHEMKNLSSPCALYHYVDQEISELSLSLDRVGCALEELEGTPLSAESFVASFRELLGRVEALQNSLKLYTEMLVDDYDQRCRCH